MHFSHFLVIASSLAYVVFALPIAPPEAHDFSLSNCKTPPKSPLSVVRDLAVEASLLQRDALSAQAPILLKKRSSKGKGKAPAIPVTPEQRKANKEVKKKAKAERVATAIAKGRDKKRPANAKVTFGTDARNKLDELGLHGKSRKHAKDYHKNIMKAEMEKHGAATGRVFHLAHVGGIDPNQPNHITAGLYNADGQQIKSPWTLEQKAKNPGMKTKGLFHFYTADHTNFKEPKAFANAAAKSQEKQKAAEAAKKAEEARIAEEKQARIKKQREEGMSLSAEDKKALRKDKKLAKKGAKDT